MIIHHRVGADNGTVRWIKLKICFIVCRRRAAAAAADSAAAAAITVRAGPDAKHARKAVSFEIEEGIDQWKLCTELKNR